MSKYTPDEWTLIEVDYGKSKGLKVFAVWYGNFSRGSSWKLSSDIVSKVKEDDCFIYTTNSGSKYICRLWDNRVGLYAGSVIKTLQDSYKDVKLSIYKE